jgi:lysozyme family protein
MATQTIAKAMPHVFKVEGGYVDHPRDPGGATNLGVTLATLRAWRKKPVSKADVKALSHEEATAIYKYQYWDKVAGDSLPAGLDYAMFDFGINSGPSRAVKFLQRILGVKVDGVIGAMTLEAVTKHPTVHLIKRLCDDRIAWMRRLKTWDTFGKGWTRRVEHVRATALSFVSGSPITEPAPKASQPSRPEEPEKKITETLKDPATWGPLTGVVSGLGSVLSGEGPAQYALAAIMVIGFGVGMYLLVKKLQKDDD